MKEPSALRGYLLAIIGSTCYGLNPLFALPLYDMGVPPLTVLLYRYALSTAMLALLLVASREGFRATRKEMLMAMGMGVLFAGSSACLFFSFKFMDAGIASVILFTYPMFVALFSWLCFGERLSLRAAICILIAFLGICLLHQPGGGEQSLLGFVLALGAGLTYALYLIGVNRSVLKSMSAVRLSFYASVSGTLLFLLCCECTGGIAPMPGAAAWSNAFGLALFPTLISILFVTRAIHIIGSTPASIIGALEPITALAVSLAVFGGSITALNILGFVLVLGAVCLMVYRRK